MKIKYVELKWGKRALHRLLTKKNSSQQVPEPKKQVSGQYLVVLGDDIVEPGVSQCSFGKAANDEGDELEECENFVTWGLVSRTRSRQQGIFANV